MRRESKHSLQKNQLNAKEGRMKEMRYKSCKIYQKIIKWQCPINSYYKCKCIKVPWSRKAQIRRINWGQKKKKKKKTRSNYMLSRRDSLYFSGHTIG